MDTVSRKCATWWESSSKFELGTHQNIKLRRSEINIMMISNHGYVFMTITNVIAHVLSLKSDAD